MITSRAPLVRMTRLHEELKARRFPNCRKIAEALEISAKTIQRDLDFMRDQLGLPIASHMIGIGLAFTMSPNRRNRRFHGSMYFGAETGPRG